MYPSKSISLLLVTIKFCLLFEKLSVKYGKTPFHSPTPSVDKIASLICVGKSE